MNVLAMVDLLALIQTQAGFESLSPLKYYVADEHDRHIILTFYHYVTDLVTRISIFKSNHKPGTLPMIILWNKV